MRWSKIKKYFVDVLYVSFLGHKNIPFFYPTAIFFAKLNSGGRGLQTAFVCGGGGKIISSGNMEKIHNFYTSCDGILNNACSPCVNFITLGTSLKGEWILTLGTSLKVEWNGPMECGKCHAVTLPLLGKKVLSEFFSILLFLNPKDLTWLCHSLLVHISIEHSACTEMVKRVGPRLRDTASWFPLITERVHAT